MSKIRISHPSSTGTALYGSQRLHRAFVIISINTDNGGDHFAEKTADDTGFKGAHASTIKRVELVYDKSKPSYTEHDERDPATGQYKIGWQTGSKLVDAPEVNQRAGGIIEVAMSFEQFAEMLVSTGHAVDCTIQSMRSIGDPGVVYQEEVTPPASIQNRASRRMAKAQATALAEIESAIAEIETWKTTDKVKDAARNRFKMIKQHIISNMGFVVTQAADEMSSVAEGAISIIVDKVAALEADGRLPKGATRIFREGGSMDLLTGGTEPELS